MAPKVCTTAFPQGAYSARVGDIVDSTSYIYSAFSSKFDDADDFTVTDDLVVTDDLTVSGDALVTGTLKNGTAEAVAVKGKYLSSTIAVSVPAISGTAVLPTDSVVVDISTSAGLTFVAAVGDHVEAIPQEALEADCLLVGAYVVGNDSVEIVFAAKEGGDGVTNANKNFKLLITDLT